MDPQRKSLQIGAAVIGTAVALRLLSGGALAPLVRALTRPETVAVLMYLETGRVVRPYNAMTYPAESPGPELIHSTEAVAPVFTAADADTVELDNETGYDPDIGALLTAPLNWDLEADHPTVLILHTHGTESYTPSPGEDYEESSAYRTLDENYNLIVDRSPKINYLAKSTPELILKRIYEQSDEPIKSVYKDILDKFQ